MVTMDPSFECAEYEVSTIHLGRCSRNKCFSRTQEKNPGWRYTVGILNSLCDIYMEIHSTISNVFYVPVRAPGNTDITLNEVD